MIENYQKLISESEHCPHCGAGMKIHKQSLSLGLVNTFITFCRAVKGRMSTSLHLQDDVGLDKNQYNNFQKLKYFGLVEKDPNRTGNWIVTEKGIGFVSGRVTVPAVVKTFRNKVIEKGPRMAFISDFTKDHTQEYWQKEFPYQIKMSKIMPIESFAVQSSIF